MIKVSTNHYNSAAKSTIALALISARDNLVHKCALCISSPGYEENCEDCACKQGCRDITRAAYYAENKLL